MTLTAHPVTVNRRSNEAAAVTVPIYSTEPGTVTASAPLAIGWWDVDGETVRVDAVDGTTAYLRAAELGADVYGGDYDRQQQIESLQRQLSREWQNLSRLPIFPRLSDGTRPQSGWRLTW